MKTIHFSLLAQFITPCFFASAQDKQPHSDDDLLLTKKINLAAPIPISFFSELNDDPSIAIRCIMDTDWSYSMLIFTLKSTKDSSEKDKSFKAVVVPISTNSEGVHSPFILKGRLPFSHPLCKILADFQAFSKLRVHEDKKKSRADWDQPELVMEAYFDNLRKVWSWQIDAELGRVIVQDSDIMLSYVLNALIAMPRFKKDGAEKWVEYTESMNCRGRKANEIDWNY